MNIWNELMVYVNCEVEEVVLNLLIEIGSQGVVISDLVDYFGQEDCFGEFYFEVEQFDMIVIIVYYFDMFDIEVVKVDLVDCLVNFEGFGFVMGSVNFDSQELVEEDWVDNWKKYYELVCIIYDLIIVLLWMDYEVKVGEKIIKLDFGMVFGIGIYLMIKMSFFVLE